jgi:hypothetical protein
LEGTCLPGWDHPVVFSQPTDLGCCLQVSPHGLKCTAQDKSINTLPCLLAQGVKGGMMEYIWV